MQILLLLIIIWDLKKIVLLTACIKNENLKRIILNAELFNNYLLSMWTDKINWYKISLLQFSCTCNSQSKRPLALQEPLVELFWQIPGCLYWQTTKHSSPSHLGDCNKTVDI
jgi:hypothetical protein